MDVIIVKMPYSDYLIIREKGKELAEDWQVMEQYHESEEIKKAEIELRLQEQNLKDLRKQFFELKHPKK